MRQYQCWGEVSGMSVGTCFPQRRPTPIWLGQEGLDLVPTHLHPLSPPGQTPEVLHCPLRVVLHPPFSLPEISAPPPARPDAMSPQDCTGRSPPSAPTTHLSTPQHSPCLYHEQVGAGTTPILQSACLSAFRPHVNHTGQTKAQRPLGSEPRGQESWGSFCSIRSQCPLLPHGPPSH